MNNISEKTIEALIKENEELKERLTLAEDTLEAIRTGAVDALAIHSEEGPKIFTLQSADRTYRSLIEEMNEGAILLNKDGMILYSNSEFAQLVNLPLPRVIGSLFFNFLPVEFLEDFLKLFLKAWEMPLRAEFVFNPINKEPVYVQLSFTVVDLNNEKTLGVVITNLTDLKNANYALERTQQQLQLLNTTLEQRVFDRTNDLNEAKKNLEIINQQLTSKNNELIKTNIDLDNFIYTASHDLKAPISNLEGLTTALQREIESGLTPKTTEIVKMISISIERLKNTILDLTEITKVQKETTEDVAEVSCAEIIEDVIFSIDNLVKTNDAQIIVESQGCHINFSRKNLKSVFYNLISNAIKYKHPERKPAILVKTEMKGTVAHFVVKDNGLGIADNHKEKVFHMFKRLHNHVDGTGVGLYIVKRIIDNAGGTIEVQSELGKGTSFLIQLPLSK